jgi:hypothetical protein
MDTLMPGQSQGADDPSEPTEDNVMVEPESGTHVAPVESHVSQAQTFTGYLRGLSKGTDNKFGTAEQDLEACCSIPFLKFYASGKNMTGKELAQLVASGGDETGELCCDKMILKLLGKVTVAATVFTDHILRQTNNDSAKR